MKQTPKSLALGMTVHQMTGSTKLINILHGLGHSVSSSTVCKHDSALASISNAADQVNIPRNVNVGLFTTIVWDNNDFNEETLTGKGTTHVTNGIVIQRGEPAHNRKVTVNKKIRTLIAPEQNIKPYTSMTKGVPSLSEHSSDLEIDIDVHRAFQQHGIQLDFAYVVCRIVSSDIGSIIPGWTGFNSQLSTYVPDLSNIGYLPVIDSPATDMATVNAVLKQSIFISQHLQIPEIVLYLTKRFMRRSK